MKHMLALFVMMAFAVSCKKSTPTSGQSATSGTSIEIPADFDAFYARFHHDSIYQMEHIMFPLSGLPDYTKSEDAIGFKWQAADWRMHRQTPETLKGFSRKRVPLSEDLIIEYLVQDEINHGTERRFARMGDEWMLIYYAGLNPMGK